MRSTLFIYALLPSTWLACEALTLPRISFSKHLDVRKPASKITQPTLEPVTDHSTDGGNSTGDEIGRNYFQVPGTQTRVLLALQRPASASATRGVLNETYQFILQQIAASGDGQIPQSRDPFKYDIEQGVYISMQSRPGQHLTWGIMGATVGWMLKHLGEQSYAVEGYFQVYDSGWGDWAPIGYGSFQPGYLSNGERATIIEGPAGVTVY